MDGPIMIIVAIDPGSTSTGYAVLEASPAAEQLVLSGTWRRRPRERPPTRHVGNCQAIAALVAQVHPRLIAYEEFRYRGRHNRVDPNEAQWVDRLIGYVLSLGGGVDAPCVVGLQPDDWGKALLGQARHDKAQIAWAVNCRLGTTFRGAGGAHDSDACGLGLVAIDRYRFTQRAGERKENTHGL